jgi:GNAT superfamily N-acetyltransferase
MPSPPDPLRLANPRDAAEVARLSTQLGYPASGEVMRERLEQLLASPLHVVIVAEGDRGLLGWVLGERRLMLETGPRVELAGLVVDATARRTGIGRRLVREVERWALAQGCDTVFVRSNVARDESHPFYERLGYERMKTQHTYRKLVSGS